MLQVAEGFMMPVMGAQSLGVFTPTGGQLIADDVQHILAGDVGGWMLSLMQADPLIMDETMLDAHTVGPLLLEFLTTQAVLSFNVRANSVMPRTAVGRIVMVDYTPWKRKDPPIPLLSLLTLDIEAILAHNMAIRDFLAHGTARRMYPALSAVLNAGVGLLKRSEAFFYYTKMLSLATGAYHQRYDTSHVFPAGVSDF